MGRSVVISTTVETDVDVDVEVDLDDFDDDDLVKEIRHRGFTLLDANHPDPELIKDRIFKLKTVYDTMSLEFFERELKLFFRRELES